MKFEDYIDRDFDELNYTSQNFADYGRGNIGDLITEIADDRASIYYSDMIDWLKEGCNECYVNDAVNEGLVDTKDFDIFRAIQCGQYKQTEEELYSDLDNEVKYGVLWNLKTEIERATNEELEKLTEFVNSCDFDDVNREFEDCIQEVRDFIENGYEDI